MPVTAMQNNVHATGECYVYMTPCCSTPEHMHAVKCQLVITVFLNQLTADAVHFAEGRMHVLSCTC